MIEHDVSFTCPHCGEPLSARFDVTGGRRQQFLQDCEVCCKPIQIDVAFDGDEVVSFSAESSE